MHAPNSFLVFALGVCSFFIATFLYQGARTTLSPFSVSTALEQAHPRRGLHLLIPVNAQAATKSPNFCKTLLSTVVHGYDPVILNWDVEGDTGFMQRMKVFAVYEYLTNLTDEGSESDIVFMMDGLDIWLQLSPETLIARFEELGTNGVVLGADKACWPNQWESAACQEVPESTLPKGTYGSSDEPEGSGMPHTRPRWANSGTVIGSVPAMRALYEDLIHIFQDTEQHGSDQGVFNDFLASRRLSLDYRSRLFWATASAFPTITAQFLNTPYHIDDLIPHELYPPLLHQAQTGEVPVAIHFNDHTQKELMEEWWGMLWWNKLQGEDIRFRHIVSSRLDGVVIKFSGGGQTTWREICPKEIINI